MFVPVQIAPEPWQTAQLQAYADDYIKYSDISITNVARALMRPASRDSTLAPLFPRGR